MPRLQQVFGLFWLGALFEDVALFVAVVTGNSAKIFLFGTGRALDITSSSWGTKLSIFVSVAPLLVHLLFLILMCLLRRFFGLGALFGLIGLILQTL